MNDDQKEYGVDQKCIDKSTGKEIPETASAAAGRAGNANNIGPPTSLGQIGRHDICDRWHKDHKYQKKGIKNWDPNFLFHNIILRKKATAEQLLFLM